MYAKINGESHATFYLTLAELNEQLPVLATFTNGKYVKYE